MSAILHDRIPYDIGDKPLPGVAPLNPSDWLLRDERFAEQMALRDQLIGARREEVIALTDGGRAAAKELLGAVLAVLADDPAYAIDFQRITRPDGVVVDVESDDPLGTLGRLVQQDFCLLERPEGADEHVLTGATLCFPAGWMLAQKIGRPLVRIHKPVATYVPDIAKRVQRLFDGVQVGRPLWRYNALGYVDPALFQPRAEGVPKYGEAAEQRFIRSERQTILRLPDTRAVVFGIHTFVVRKPL